MKIVTSGLSFLDIDAYAGCIAYAELLSLKGVPATAFSSAPFNESIPPSIRSRNTPFTTEYTPSAEDTFILIDVSEPDFLEKQVVIERVEEVIDHHVGFEEFWTARLEGDKCTIEFIGAACTLVYEKWLEASLLHEMNLTTAKLLIAGILDNTLNFKAGVTTDRDRTAYRALLEVANVTEGWAAEYFAECESMILADLPEAIRNDSKVMDFKNLEDIKLAFGQLVTWNGAQVARDSFIVIAETLSESSVHWFMNIVSIDEGVSYFLASDDTVSKWAEKVVGVRFEANRAVADRLWLRKEIVKQDLSL